MKNAIIKQTKLSFSTFILFGMLALTGISCSKDDADVDPNPDNPFVPPSAIQLNNLRETALSLHTETIVFNAEDGISFISDDGAEIQISPSCLYKEGNAVTGQVELTFIDLYEKADMAVTNKPTMGLMQNGDKAPLITGGEFFVEVRQDGDLLEMDCRYHLIVPGQNTGGFDSEMVLWNGIIDDNGDLTWDEVDENSNTEIFGQGNTYHVYLDAFGWTNIDRFHDDPRPKTTLRVAVPEGFDSANSTVYLSYNGEPNCLAHLSSFDTENGYFNEQYAQIPIGLEAHLIFLSAEGDDWRYATQGVTIADNEVYIFTIGDTEIDTLENVLTAIQNLP